MEFCQKLKKMMKNKLNQEINNLGLIAKDYLFKQSLQESSSRSSDMAYVGGRNYCDYKYESESIRLIGTEKQIDQFWIDNKFEIKDTWNAIVNEKYLNGYIDMNKQLLIIKLI